jgi:hypothetical protein
VFTKGYEPSPCLKAEEKELLEAEEQAVEKVTVTMTAKVVINHCWHKQM